MLAAALLLSACGGAASRSTLEGVRGPELAGGLRLPSPADLLARDPGPQAAGPQMPGREVSEFSRLAFAYDFMLPNSRISSSGTNLLMEPQYSPGGPLSGAAYCVYSFDYEPGETDLSDMTMHLAPADIIQQGAASNLYFLLPNYATNRWVHFPFDALPGQAGPADSTDYIPPLSATKIYLGVLAVGNQPFELARMRIGNAPPVFSLDAFPTTGQAPLDVQFTADFSAFGSEDFDTIEWDFEGDGTFELLTAPDVVDQSFQYTASGSYQAAARITDTEGASTTETATIVVSNNLTRTWGNGGDERALDLAIDSGGNVYVCGFDNDGCLLLKYDSALELQWARSWRPAELLGFGEYRSLVCIGSDVFVSGFINLHDAPPNDNDILLHKYSSDGSLTMQKIYGHATEDDEATAITTDGTSIYLTGFSWDTTDDAAHFLAAKLDNSGTVLWGKHDGLLEAAPFYNLGTAVEHWNSASSVAFLAGLTNQFATTPACLVALDPSDGTVNLQRYYTSDIQDQALVGKAMLGHASSLVLLGNYDDGFDEGYFSFDIAAAGGEASNVRFVDSIIGINPGAAALAPDLSAAGSIVFGGGTTFDAALVYHSPAADPIPFDQLDGPGGFTSQLYGIQAGSAGSFYACGWAFYSPDTVWNRDSDSLDLTQPGSITATVPGFNFEDWTPNASDTAIAAADISGTQDSGGGGQDILVSRLVPGL
ncbi:PKD domain-containing protein [bacterium]|nr:PKD domain-containing protein [bacterium]